METLNYLNNGHGLASWLLTRDHKRIALLYLASITAFFFIGGMFAFMIRLELLTPVGTPGSRCWARSAPATWPCCASRSRRR